MRHRERGTRSSQPGQDVSDPDQILEALLAGGPLPGEDQAALQPVADVLAALRQPAAPAELTGEASALAEFRAQPRRTAGAALPRRRRGPVAGVLLRPRPALLFAGAAMLAGLAVGGYEGDLPAPVQQWAHHTFGLTAARGKASHPPRRPGGRASTLTPTAGPGRRGRHPAHGDQPGHSTQHDASHQPAGRAKRRPDGSHGTPAPSPSSGPSSRPSPSASGTPSPSTSPAAQPSQQASTAPSPHRSQQTGSGAPSSPP